MLSGVIEFCSRMQEDFLEQSRHVNSCAGCFALFFLSFVFFTILFSCIFLLLRIQMPVSTLFTGWVAASFVTAVFLRNMKKLILCISVCSCVLFCFYLLSTLYPDYSIDGPLYHQSVSEALRQGKNIFFETTGNFWGDVYPKAHVIFAGEASKLLPHINSAAFLDCILAAGVFFYCLYCGKQLGVIGRLTWICAFLFALHPVAIQQIYTYYVDSVVYFCSFFIMASTILMISNSDAKLDKRACGSR